MALIAGFLQFNTQILTDIEKEEVIRQIANHLPVKKLDNVHYQIYGTKSEIKNIVNDSPWRSHFLVGGLTDDLLRNPLIINPLGFRPRTPGGPFSPLDLATVYGFPNGNGSGQKIGIISLGGGFYQQNIDDYFVMIGVGQPAPIIVVAAGVNAPGVDDDLDIENTLDIEVIAALCPQATINIYIGTREQSSSQAMIQQAINDNCNILSLSFGSNEVQDGSADAIIYDNLFIQAKLQSISVFVATGDHGSLGFSNLLSGNNVEKPASSPNCTAVGGTTLVAPGNVWTNETAWSGSGGGISRVFFIPDYQTLSEPVRHTSASQSYNLGGFRLISDVSAFADPTPGYQIYYNNGVDPPTTSIGGTSASTPLYAGLFGRINSNLGKNCGFINPVIYQNVNAFRDITEGSNGSYPAKVGWDPPTGLGSPLGTALQAIFDF